VKILRKAKIKNHKNNKRGYNKNQTNSNSQRKAKAKGDLCKTQISRKVQEKKTKTIRRFNARKIKSNKM